MKISVVKKMLVKQTVITVAVLSVVGGGMWYLSSLSDEYDGEINSLNARVNGIVQQAVNLSTQHDKVTAEMSLYNEISKKQEEKKLTISKLSLRDAISAARATNHINNLDVKMDEIKRRDGEKYKRETTVIESSNVNIGLDAISDLDIAGLIQSLEKEFWGAKFTSLKITKVQELDEVAITSVKKSGFSPIVNAKIGFTLFGIHNISKGDNDLLNYNGGVGAAQIPPLGAGR